jgi:hypothetical protein
MSEIPPNKNPGPGAYSLDCSNNGLLKSENEISLDVGLTALTGVSKHTGFAE